MSTRTTIERLPEEVLREILDYALTKPVEAFFTQHRNDSAQKQPNDVVSQAELLTVCKAWQRIGTPLLYAFLCLGSTEHTQTVARVLKESPRLGQAIKHLRLDGGLGPDLSSVVRLAPKVRSLYVNTAIAAEESLGGLRRALALLSPTTLFIYSPKTRDHNVKQTQVDALLEAMIRQRPSIELVQFEPTHTYLPWSMLHALVAAPRLRIVSIDICLLRDAFVNGRSSIERLAQSSTLEKIICRRTASLDSTLKGRHSEHFLGLLSFRADTQGRTLVW